MNERVREEKWEKSENKKNKYKLAKVVVINTKLLFTIAKKC